MRAAGGAAEDELSHTVTGEVVSGEKNRRIVSRFGLNALQEDEAVLPAEPKEEGAAALKEILGVRGSKGKGDVCAMVAVEIRGGPSHPLRELREEA